jgi:hypothetical protein
MRPDGEYIRRQPAEGEARRAAQQVFIEQCAERAAGVEPRVRSG